MCRRPPDDLPFLADAFECGSRSYLAFKHFDSVKHRDHFGLDFFSSLRCLVMEAKQLVLLTRISHGRGCIGWKNHGKSFCNKHLS